ncbi:unnamed protein product [Rotaria socialis]|uniref:Macro domain-containing protein n=1 Tax=Rotaria socialis TaxID=392032 RepID=A0A817TE88_9BILA|nr:unnamed protein product [Rotaria socialis]
MSSQVLEKILNLFDNFQTIGKPLQINIEQDLLPIIPLPRKIIIDLLTDERMPKIFYLSEDQNTVCFQNNLRLCATDQNKGGSCNSSSCDELHICKNYLLNINCLQFDNSGRCLHSHSLLTKHNKNILDKLNLPSEDERTFALITHLIRISLSLNNPSNLILQTLDGQKITDNLIDLWLNGHKPFLRDKKFINENTVQLIFEDDEIASMMENFIMENHRRTVLIKKNLSFDEISSLNKSKIFQIQDQLISNSNHDRQEKDLDNEVESSTSQSSSTFAQQFKSNEKDVYLNKSPSEYSNRIGTFGRGRGKKQLNNVPPSPSLSSKENLSCLYNSTSPEISRKNQLSSLDSLKANEKKIIFSQRLYSMKVEDTSQSTKPKLVDNNTNTISEINNKEKNHDVDKFSYHNTSQLNNSSHSTKFEQQENNQYEIHNHNSPSNNDSSGVKLPQNVSSMCSDVNSKTRFVLRGYDTKSKEKSIVRQRSQTPVNYIYKKQFTDQNLCYLLGPGKEHIVENDQCQILAFLPSGYCRSANIEQGKDIEKRLYSILSDTLNIETLKINNHLALLVCSPAAEYIFQQSQTHYAIITEPSQVHVNIDVINESTTNQKRSSPVSTKNNASSSIEKSDSQQFSSDGKFHISATDSSMSVISGDISQIPVDMMICVSTSNNLRDSILRRAGIQIESQYKERYRPTDALLLDGGSTAARKILFVPWQTEVEQTETTKTQKSLSDLIKWCIEQAHQRKMKSISFPPIGTGQLGLDPAFVCEAMISAASERLHQYKMDVLFVIYSSTGLNSHHDNDDECYQIFRIYLDSLNEQIKSIKVATSAINNQQQMPKSFDMEKTSIQRDILGKRVLTLSNSSNIIEYHHLLIKSLENLMYEKIFDLSLIESTLIDKIDLLIDICLQYHVHPHIDFVRKELKLYGDKDSCFQCFSNLRHDKKVHQYTYVFTQHGEKSDENKINSFISLKIDEAFAVEESNICVNDNDQTILNIDLNHLQIKINGIRDSAYLIKRQINLGPKIKIPSSWSSSLLMIRTNVISKSSYESLQCFQVFYQTMAKDSWQIERIDSIENYPLYIHFMNKRTQESQLYFHGCSYSSIQSIIHYGLHSTNASIYGDKFENQSIRSICLTRDALNSHLYGSRRSTDGKHYIFALQLAKYDLNDDFSLLQNEDTHLALPTHLIVYQRRKNN